MSSQGHVVVATTGQTSRTVAAAPGGGKKEPHIFRPRPPQRRIWDAAEHEEGFLNTAKARIQVNMNYMDAKSGLWEASVRCDWQFRLPFGDDPLAKELLPCVRFPACTVDMKEERIFNETDLNTTTTKMWRGLSSFVLSGYEKFEVADFPFDRQLIDLKILDFRWMPEREKIDIVDLTVKTMSRTACWDPFYAVVTPKKVRKAGDTGPECCSRFNVQLRFQRAPDYYIHNIFNIAGGILLASLFPLAMDPNNYGDRLGGYAGGVLTLVAFKYGISEQLPSVPYNTLADNFLSLQLFTLVFAMLESLVVYKAVNFGLVNAETMNIFDDILLIILSAVWLGYMFYMATIKKRRRRSWQEVLSMQEAPVDELDGD